MQATQCKRVARSGYHVQKGNLRGNFGNIHVRLFSRCIEGDQYTALDIKHHDLIRTGREGGWSKNGDRTVSRVREIPSALRLYRYGTDAHGLGAPCDGIIA